jgi:hypothetical protein
MSNEMSKKIYTVTIDGVPFTEQQLAEGLRRIEEARKQDARYIPEVGQFFRWIYKGAAPTEDRVYLRLNELAPHFNPVKILESLVVCSETGGVSLFSRYPSSYVEFYQVEGFHSPSRFSKP